MQYTADIKFVKGKTSLDQTRTDLKCAQGVIHKIEIVFPQGSSNLVNLQLFLGGHPIAPSTQNQTFKGNNETINIPEFIELRNFENLIIIRGWNEDATYDHNILVRIYVLPKFALQPTNIAEGIVAALRSVLRSPYFPR